MKKVFEFVLALQFAIWLVVVLDIPIARQIIGFVYLLFVPGIIFLRTIRFDGLNTIETILFSAGSSIALLMFIGLLMNELFPLIGISNPLSTLPLIITVSIFVLILFISNYYGGTNSSHSLSIKSPSILSSHIQNFLLILPLLSISGATLVKISGNNSILLLMIIIISALIILGSLYKRLISTRFYSWAILSIAVALLFHVSLTSSHLYGTDIHSEYYVFQLVKNESFWKSTIMSTPRVSHYNNMLSTTILPTVFSNLLNVPGVWVFKIIYPIIFSLVPLGFYQTYQKQFGKRTAFLSTFFLMSFSYFYQGHLAAVRQMIGELFFILLIFLLFEKGIQPFKRKILFIIFSMGLIVSHYSISYMFMFLIFLTWIFSLFMRNKTRITGPMGLMFFIMSFSWYMFVSASSVLDAIVQIGHHILATLHSEFFNPISRDPKALISIGIGGPAESIGHEIGRGFHFVTEVFIIIGVIVILWNRKKSKYNREYVLMSVVSLVLLSMSIVIPYFAAALGMTRTYYLSLFFLAPACILGGETVFRYTLSKVSGKIFAGVNVKTLVTTVLILYFLFNVGFIYEITSDVPSSHALSMHRMNTANERAELYNWYTSDYEIFSARWLARMRNPSTIIYADLVAKIGVLTSYGMIPQEEVWILLNSTERPYGTYIYLRGVNTVDGKMVSRYKYDFEMWNLSDISYLFDGMNKIYSNAKSDIYKGIEWNQG